MSTLDTVLAQKQIIASLILAAAPLLAAVLIYLVGSLRRYANERAHLRQQQVMMIRQARAEYAARAAEGQNSGPAAPGYAPQNAVEPVRVQAATVVPAQAGVPEPISGSAVQAPQASGPAGAGAAQPEEAAEQPDESNEAEPDAKTSEMQALLSDVFGDDEVTAQYEVLLRGVDEVSLNDLVSLGQDLAERLRSQAVPSGKN